MRILLTTLMISIFHLSSSQVLESVDGTLNWVEENQDIDINGSLDSLENALKLARKKKDYRSEVKLLLRSSQFTLYKLNNVAKASEYIERIRKMAISRNNDPWGLSTYHNGKGVLYYFEGTDKERAFREFRRSNEIMKRAGLEEDPRMLNNYALAVLSEQNTSEALKIFKRCRALELNSTGGGRPSDRFLETNASNIGVCFIYLGIPDSAQYYFKQALELSDETPGFADDFSSRVYLGVFFEEQGKNDEAIKVLSEAEQYLEYSPSWGMKSLLCQAYMGIYKNMGDFQKALAYSERSKVYEDSLRNYKLSEQAFAMDYKLELDKVKAQQKIRALETSVKEKDFIFRIAWLSSIILVLISLGAFLFYRLNKQKELNRIKAENASLEKERIRQEAELELLRKDEQLITANVEISVRENELTALRSRLEEHLNKNHDPQFHELRQFLKQVQQSQKKTEQLRNLDNVLSLTNTIFYSRLKELHPKLTEEEKRLITLIRLNLSTEELLLVFNITKSSLNTKRYRVRKKMGLSSDQSLEDYVMGI